MDRYPQGCGCKPKETAVKIRVWCEKHQVPLEAIEGDGPFFIPANIQHGSDPKGEWEVDLSDMGCPKEELDEELDNPLLGPGACGSWSIRWFAPWVDDVDPWIATEDPDPTLRI
jgi:hypothetical protein